MIIIKCKQLFVKRAVICEKLLDITHSDQKTIFASDGSTCLKTYFLGTRLLIFSGVTSKENLCSFLE